MKRIIFALARVLFLYCYPLYKLSYYAFKRWQDADEIALIRRVLKPGDTVLDIGANIGFYSEFLSAIVGPTGTVHAFEPDPINLRRLRASCAGKPNVVVTGTAIGNRVGELTLFRSRLGNVDHRTYRTDNYETSVTVPTDTVDRYLNGRKVALIKMDIQGAEYFALQGMERTLEANPDVVILAEFWPFAMAEAGASVAALQDLLAGKGFGIYRVGGGSLERMDDLSRYKPTARYDQLQLLFAKRPL